MTTCKIISSEGYKSLTTCGKDFLAAGSNGFVYRISTTGEVLKSEKVSESSLNCILHFDNKTIVGGTNGIIKIAVDNGDFLKINTGTDNTVYCLTNFNNKIITGSELGKLFIINEKGLLSSKQLPLKGNIVSISANSSDCYGVTDAGEIIHSLDGIDWTVFDFNEFYSGYYKKCSFTKILITDNRIAITGKYTDGNPVLMFSAQGNVWVERNLDYTDENGMPNLLKAIPSDIIYDYSRDEFLLGCSEGNLITIPSCSHCNKLNVYTNLGIMCLSGNENTLIMAGENYFIKTIPASN
jgi:hypothetical protein